MECAVLGDPRGLPLGAVEGTVLGHGADPGTTVSQVVGDPTQAVVVAIIAAAVEEGALAEAQGDMVLDPAAIVVGGAGSPTEGRAVPYQLVEAMPAARVFFFSPKITLPLFSLLGRRIRRRREKG